MAEFDFSTASLDDFKVAGEAQPVAQTEAPVETPVEAPTEAPQEVKQVEKPADVEKTYNFKDDFIKGAVEFYEKTGDLTPYLQAKTVDFTKMSDEEIMRRDLREQYSELSDSAFERLYKQQVTDKFKIDADEWGEDDAGLGKELLRTEANKLRSKYLDWQKNFSAPEPETSNDQEQAIELMKKFEEGVRNNSLTKSLLESKKLSIKTADGEFNYEIPQADTLLDMTLDNDRFFGQFADDSGELNYERWYKTAAYSQNPELFERSLINYGKTLGRQEITKEIKNPSNTSSGDVPTETSGDFRSGLLQAFASRGIQK
jgi:hypothetical protein